MISIRRRLLVGLLTAVGLVWFGIAAMVYHVAQHEAEEVFDAQLAQYARVLQRLVAAHQTGGQDPRALPLPPALIIRSFTEQVPEEGHRYERKLRFHVWDANGRLLVSSQEPPVSRVAPTAAGYGTESADGHEWRTFSLVSGDRGPRVYVAERDDIRGELVAEVVVRQMAPGLLAFPIFGLVIWIVVGRGLHPLQRVAREVSRRNPEQLEALRVADVPTETRPLVDALNRLFERLQTAFERERRFIADAAHELRTPIAAIKTQAQTAMAAQDARQRQHALDNIVRGVDRATHLEAQLLTLARLDPEARASLRHRDVKLVPLARAVLAELGPSAVAKDIDLGLDAADAIATTGDPDLLAILLRNLVENAIRHTPEGGSVTVTLAREPGTVVLGVADTGPGISDADRERVFERFYRASVGRDCGSGLGLSIVKRIADLHGASVMLQMRPEGGLLATVRLPAPGTSFADRKPSSVVSV